MLGADQLATFSQSISVPSLIAPLVEAEPQRPVKEEEPKTAGDPDQESVRAWGPGGDWPESEKSGPRETEARIAEESHS